MSLIGSPYLVVRAVDQGHEVQLVEDGEVLRVGMEETGPTRRDLERALRESGEVPDASAIRMAYMERDGSISVVPKSSEPKVVDIAVQDGVQTVRIVME